MKDAATKSYSKKGDAIVKMNHDAIERGANGYVKIDVPASWKDAADDSVKHVATGDRPELATSALWSARTRLSVRCR